MVKIKFNKLEVNYYTETFLHLKVSVCSDLDSSSTKLCGAQHVLKSKDLITLANGGKI